MLAAYAKLDEKYMDPNFIALIILAPVKEIVEILSKIMERDQIWKIGGDTQSKNKNKEKIGKALRFWYTMCYMKALTSVVRLSGCS